MKRLNLLKRSLRVYIDDILAVVGAGCISTGAFYLHPSVGFIITGVLCITAAYLLGGGDSD